MMAGRKEASELGLSGGAGGERMWEEGTARRLRGAPVAELEMEEEPRARSPRS